MSKYTPGPWHIKTSTSGNYFAYSNEACRTDDRIAGVSGTFPDSDTAQANARLIAKAPELVEALRDLLESVSLESDFGVNASAKRLEAKKKARALLTEIDGGQS